ncbi:DNA polymerase-3 subunit delta' [Corticibacter populi]|nr:DNA polymerase-3 subunit delta' [Corticibacter populi]
MPWLRRQLDALLQQQGHALLLQGASGLGQFELALQVAKAMLCEGRASDAPAAPACNQCESCHAVDVHTHPDLCVLLPEALQLEWGWSGAEAETGDSKRKPSREIRIEAMRQMIAFSQRTNARGRGKVVLVYPAENMNAFTANALLKTLEEPPGDTRFVLATDASHRLLPTIRSRCHSWSMAWPQPDEAADWLAAQGLDAAQARQAIRVAGGRPADALALARAGWQPSQWEALPRQLSHGQAGMLADASPSQAIGVLLKLCHDLMAQAVGAAPRFFPAEALQPLLPAAASDALAPERRRALDRLGQWSAALLQAARTSEHPFSADLMITALVDQARSALNLRH